MLTLTNINSDHKFHVKVWQVFTRSGAKAFLIKKRFFIYIFDDAVHQIKRL